MKASTKIKLTNYWIDFENIFGTYNYEFKSLINAPSAYWKRAFAIILYAILYAGFSKIAAERKEDFIEFKMLVFNIAMHPSEY